MCMNKKTFFTFLISLIILQGNAQEVISGLQRNYALKQQESFIKNILIDYTPVTIPFIDDFSNYTVFPNPNLWIDKYVFVNSNYSSKPPTIGVATFDALNTFGSIYANAQSTTFPADTLTSRPIRLDTLFSPVYRPITISDSLYFSFYYQPGGSIGQPWEMFGDKPELNDSLVLEFGYRTGNIVLDHYIKEPQQITTYLLPGDSIENHCYPGNYIYIEQALFPEDTVWVPCDSVMKPEMVWTKVWGKTGQTLQQMVDSTGKYFDYVLIPITNEQYLNAGFQFRFRNYASLGNNTLPGWLGNVDQWNIDYIKLDINRTYQDTILKDVAFVNLPPSTLKKYQSMPWNQMKGFQNNELKDTVTLQLTNLDVITKNTTLVYNAENSDHSLIYSYDGGSFNLEPYTTSGYQTYQPHARPPIKFTFPEDMQDSAEFLITYIHKEAGLGDKRAENDTVRYFQKFHNYFAYDDGSPENGYGLSVAGGKLAYRFKLNTPDTIQAIQMFFNQTFDHSNQQSFYLTIWNNLNNKPGEIIYEQAMVLPIFEDSINEFHTYKLDEPLYVSGTFYVGWRQTTEHNLNLGFDRNNNSSENIFYNTDGVWVNSFYTGSLMIRPMLGKRFSMVGMDEPNVDLDVQLYPNPNNGNVLYLKYSENMDANAMVNVFDITGRLIFSEKISPSISISSLHSGIYFVEIQSKGNKISKRLIISK